MRKYFFLFGFLLILLLLIPSVNAVFPNTTFSSCRNITVTNTSAFGNTEFYPFFYNMTFATNQSDYNDTAFYNTGCDVDTGAFLSFWKENYTANYGLFWINATGRLGENISVYYNSSSIEDRSNGNRTFNLFLDPNLYADNTALNTILGWNCTVTGASACQINTFTGGRKVINISATASGFVYPNHSITCNQNCSFETAVYIQQATEYAIFLAFGRGTDTVNGIGFIEGYGNYWGTNANVNDRIYRDATSLISVPFARTAGNDYRIALKWNGTNGNISVYNRTELGARGNPNLILAGLYTLDTTYTSTSFLQIYNGNPQKTYYWFIFARTWRAAEEGGLSTSTSSIVYSGAGVGGGATDSFLALHTNQTNRFVFFNNQTFITNITVTNRTTNATVGTVWIEFNNTNYTMTRFSTLSGSSQGGIFNFNTSLNLSAGLYTIKVTANNTISTLNESNSTSYFNITILDYNITLDSFTQNVYETNFTQFNLSIDFGSNVREINASLQWNDTRQIMNYSMQFNSSVTNRSFVHNISISLQQNNNSNVTFNWTIYIYYYNSSSFTTNTSGRNQTVIFAYYFDTIQASKTTLLDLEIFYINTTFNQTIFRNTSINITLNLNNSYYINTSFIFNRTWQSSTAISQWRFLNLFLTNISDNNATATFSVNFSILFAGVTRRVTAGNTTIIIYHPQLSGSCTSGISLFNTTVIRLFTYNESTNVNNTGINVTVDTSFVIWDGVNISNNRTNSFSLTNNTGYTICMYPNWGSFQVDNDFVYSATNYPQREYFLTNATISNTSTNISLYILHNTLANRVFFTVQDSQGNLKSNIIIKLLKYFPATNNYVTVAMAKTDFAGKAVTYLGLYDIFYKKLFELDYKIVKETSPAPIQCTDATTCTQLEVIETALGTELYKYIRKIAGTCRYANSTLTLTCTYSDVSGLGNNMCLDIYDVSFAGTNLLSTQCQSSTSSGSLGYTFETFNRSKTYSYTFYAILPNLATNTTVLASGIQDFVGIPTLGNEGIIVAYISIATIAFLGIFNPIVGILLSVMAFGIMNLLGIIEFGTATTIFIVIAALIIIWRIKR